jgi:hypothetical protein
MPNHDAWPPLPLAEWQDTYRALHMWTQIVGKIRMKLTPPVNHWWHVPLYVNSLGLTTSAIPYGPCAFELQFDFVEHQLRIHKSDGASRALPLLAQPVSEFYATLMAALHELDIQVTINPKPQEVQDATPFDQDHRPGAYDRDAVERFWQILLSTQSALYEFRGRFLGKSSPVHFFWGSFDLACTRFSGRKAPPRKGAISGPAYSHEVISAGFWPGAGFDGPAFYAYAVPSPAGYEKETVRPARAGWNTALSEFILMYDDVRTAADPRAALMEFLESTFDAGARLAKWDPALLVP